MRGEATTCNQVAFGDFAMVSLGLHWITARQIEAARIAISRHTKRGGKMWIRVFPDIPYTKKPAETRMGKGKGSPEYWVAEVKPGTILFEIAGVPVDVARRAMELATAKLPIQTRFVERREVVANV
jgi:large subunit ribosomal protein L16